MKDLKLDDLEVKGGAGLVIISSVVDRYAEDLGLDPGEAEKLRDWLSLWLDDK